MSGVSSFSTSFFWQHAQSDGLDFWTPREIALFESGICSFGKDFLKISKVVSLASDSSESCQL
jgi:hypothetical protein